MSLPTDPVLPAQPTFDAAVSARRLRLAESLLDAYGMVATGVLFGLLDDLAVLGPQGDRGDEGAMIAWVATARLLYRHGVPVARF